MSDASPETGRITVSRFGIVIDGNPDYETWRDVFDGELTAKNRSAWTMGDLITYGEAKYGEIAADVLDGRTLSIGTLYNNASLCKTFPPDERRYDLTASHYAAVAKLANVDRERAHSILADAVARELGRDDVRMLAKQALGETTPTPPLKVLARVMFEEGTCWFSTTDPKVPTDWDGREVEIRVRAA